jgi:transcriptional regulator with XRE-family HTH domain
MFYKKIKFFRERANLTQNEVAESLSLSPQSVSKWERNESLPSTEYLPKLAKLYGCKIDDFFNDDESLDLDDNDNKIIEIDTKPLTQAFAVLQKAYIDGKLEELKHFTEDNLTILHLIMAVAKFAKAQKVLTVSLIRRKFNIGYCRAGNIMDGFESLNLVSKWGEGTLPKQRDLYLPAVDNFLTFLKSHVKPLR